MQIVHGNAVEALLRREVDVLMHCCNCQNTFGAGIAKEIKNKIPEAYLADIEAYKSRRSGLLGTFSAGGGVYNLYGQLRYGRGVQIDYIAFSEALRSALIDASSNTPKRTKVAIPYKIGCGLAGGDWARVSRIIEICSLGLGVDIILYDISGRAEKIN